MPSGYEWPASTSAVVARSFCWHALCRGRANASYVGPTREECEAVVGRLLTTHLHRHRQPPQADSPEFDGYFDYILRTIEDKTSATGLGIFQRYATIGDALGWDGLTFRAVQRVEELRKCVKAKLRRLESRVPTESWFGFATEGRFDQEIFQLAETDEAWRNSRRMYEEFNDVGTFVLPEEGCPKSGDPPADIKMFVKDEPHKQGKIAAGRHRLISCLAFEDQMVDRILFYAWQRSEVDDYSACASKAGWAPIPGGYAEMLASFPEEEKSLAIDKTAWDWTMPEWVVVVYFMVKLAQVGRPGLNYARTAWNRMRQVVGPDAYVRLPSGRRWRQSFWGMMKSGWFLTLSMNSMAQAAQHELACLRMKIPRAPLLWAMGDDSLINWTLGLDVVCEYIEHLGKTGCLIKHFKFCREFCGFRVYGTEKEPVVDPLYPGKHRFSLAYVSPKVEDETTLSYTLIYALAKNYWCVDYEHHFKVPRTSMQKAWAKGLIELRLDFAIPKEFKWEE